MTHRRDPLTWVQIPVLPLYSMINMKIKEIKWNAGLIISIIVAIAGLVYYIGWGMHYHVWTDIGIYSVTVFLMGIGIIGSLISITKS